MVAWLTVEHTSDSEARDLVCIAVLFLGFKRLTSLSRNLFLGSGSLERDLDSRSDAMSPELIEELCEVVKTRIQFGQPHRPIEFHSRVRMMLLLSWNLFCFA